MTITDVRVKLAADPTDRLLAFCSLTLDGCFVVRDLKLIRGATGPFVAMPSRKITARCDGCAGKNPLAAKFCGECGAALAPPPDDAPEDAKPRRYADVAHPINARCREQVQTAVLAAVEREKVLAAEPDYVCRYDEQDVGEPAPAPPVSFTPAAPPAPPAVPRGVRVDAAEPVRPATRRAARSPLRAATAVGAFGDGI